MSEPTARPWTIAADESNEYVNGADNKRVANCNAGERYWREAEANAALIVRAVNAHDELLAACEAFAAAFDDLFGQCCSSSIKNTWGQPVNLTKLNEANTTARAALDLARTGAAT